MGTQVRVLYYKNDMQTSAILICINMYYRGFSQYNSFYCLWSINCFYCSKRYGHIGRGVIIEYKMVSLYTYSTKTSDKNSTITAEESTELSKQLTTDAII